MCQLKVFLLLGLIFSSSAGLAQATVADLTEKDLVQNPERLAYEWQMEYGKLLTAKEMRAVPEKELQSVPGYWNIGSYKGQQLPGSGFATYYLRVLVDKDDQNLAINPIVTSTNYQLYVNNTLLGEVGKVGKNKEEAEPNYIKKTYKLPPHNGVLDIVLHISNYHYRKGGMGRAPIIGDYDTLTENRSIKIAILFFLMGSIFFMGLYHVGISIFRRNDKLAKYFSIVCFLTILRSLSVDEYLLIEYFNFPWWLSTKVELISFFLLLAFTIKFVYYMFPSFIPGFFVKAPYFLAVGASILAAILPMAYASYLVPLMQITTVVTAVGLMFFIVKESFKGDKEVIIALIGFTLLFAVTLMEILSHRLHFKGELVFSFGVFLYLFSHVIIMAMRLNATYERNEELGEALQTINRELEAKVLLRTKQLSINNKALLKSNEELKKINEEKNGLVHVVAHDLKSPLANSIGLIQLMRMDKQLSQEQCTYLQHLENSAKQGMSLINDLLVLYNLESRNERTIEAIDLSRFFSETVYKYTGLARQKQIDLISKIKPSEQLFYTDEGFLSRILDNLISNAIKFSHQKTCVILKATFINQQLAIEIIDEGMGILDEEKHKVFKKFQKMSNKPTDNESSSGLGLSIVKELVERLNGEVTFSSVYGKGSTFYVKLPNLKK